ncbi:MAG TPA: OmpA family protein, partial [Longimicrobiales bacterium]|nr:OmpA family protein [Longimicrobiales bacterium]
VANAELREAERRLEATMVQFVRGSAALAPGQDGALATLVSEVRRLDAVARQWGVRYRVTITGHTDADGPPERNLELSRERAAVVADALRRESFAALIFEARGMGSAEPLTTGTTDADKQRNRRVAVRIAPLAETLRP